MADNTTLNTGSGGDVIATDDIGGVKYQLVKVVFGPLDTATLVEATVGLPVVPFSALLEVGITALIGPDDAEIAAGGELSNTADLALTTTLSGEIVSVLLVSYETGSGAVQFGRGRILFFDADPNTSAGDSDLAAAGAEYLTILGIVDIEKGDWDSDATGAAVFKSVAIPFHAIGTVYAVYRNTDGSAVWNSAVGDNEELDINIWYRRES